MNLLQFVVLVLLGLLAPSAGAVPHQMTDVTADNTLRDLSRTVGKPLGARQGYPSNLLLRYDLKCALDPENTDFAPSLMGLFLEAGYCKNWFDCKSDGTKVLKPTEFDPYDNAWTIKGADRAWQVNDLDILSEEVGANQLNYRCEKWCECVLVDEPQQHYAANFGCPNPAGKQIHGNYGSVSRDAGSGALVMEAHDGPPRKE